VSTAESRRAQRMRRACYRRARDAARAASHALRSGSPASVALYLSEVRTWRGLGSAWLSAARAWEMLS